MGKRKDRKKHRKRNKKEKGAPYHGSRQEQYTKARHLAKGMTQEEIDEKERKWREKDREKRAEC